MKSFLPLCESGVLCAVCNHRDHHAIHRAAWRLKFEGVPADGIPCLIEGRRWGQRDIHLPVIASADEQARNLAHCLAGCQFREPAGTCLVCGSCGARDCAGLANQPLGAGCPKFWKQ